MRKRSLSLVLREILDPHFAGWLVLTVGVLGMATYMLGMGRLSMIYSCITTLGLLLIVHSHDMWQRSETREGLHQLATMHGHEGSQSSLPMLARKVAARYYVFLMAGAVLLGVLGSVYALAYPVDYLYVLVMLTVLVGGYAYLTRHFWVLTAMSVLMLTVLQQGLTLDVEMADIYGVRVIMSVYVLGMTTFLARQKQTVTNRRPIRMALVLLLLVYVQIWLSSSLNFSISVFFGGFSYVVVAALAGLYSWLQNARMSFARDLGVLAGIVMLCTLLLLQEFAFVAVVFVVFSAALLLAGVGLPSRTARQMSILALLASSLYYLWLLEQYPASQSVLPILLPVSFLGDPLVILLAAGWWWLKDSKQDRLVLALRPGLLAALGSVVIARWSYALTGINQLAFFVFITAIISIVSVWLRIHDLKIVALLFAVLTVLNTVYLADQYSAEYRLQLVLVLVAATLVTVITLASIITKRRYAY